MRYKAVITYLMMEIVNNYLLITNLNARTRYV